VGRRGGLVWRRVASKLCVPVQEPGTQLRGAAVLQVHSQESGVIEPVEVAQPIVELQAVQHPRAIIRDEDVSSEQVAVAIDDAPGALPGGQQRRSPVEETYRPALEFGHQRVVQHGSGEPPQLLEAVGPPGAETVGPPGAQRLPPALGGDLRIASGTGVEGGQHPGQRPHRIIERRPGAQQGGQPPRRRDRSRASRCSWL